MYKRLPLSDYGRFKVARLRYTQTVTFAPDGGAGEFFKWHVWRANGLFDPDQTGVGGQPKGYDDLAAIYARNIVIGARCRMEYIPNYGSQSNVGATPGMFGVYSTDRATIFTDNTNALQDSDNIRETTNIKRSRLRS